MIFLRRCNYADDQYLKIFNELYFKISRSTNILSILYFTNIFTCCATTFYYLETENHMENH